jgi:hypothetical protein
MKNFKDWSTVAFAVTRKCTSCRRQRRGHESPKQSLQALEVWTAPPTVADYVAQEELERSDGFCYLLTVLYWCTNKGLNRTFLLVSYHASRKTRDHAQRSHVECTCATRVDRHQEEQISPAARRTVPSSLVVRVSTALTSQHKVVWFDLQQVLATTLPCQSRVAPE